MPRLPSSARAPPPSRSAAAAWRCPAAAPDSRAPPAVPPNAAARRPGLVCCFSPLLPAIHPLLALPPVGGAAGTAGAAVAAVGGPGRGPPRGRSSPTMNIFRIAGDMSHVASIAILLLKMKTSRNCAGTWGCRTWGGVGGCRGATRGAAESERAAERVVGRRAWCYRRQAVSSLVARSWCCFVVCGQGGGWRWGGGGVL